MKALFMKTKKGNGYKIVIDGTWLYASKKLLHEAIENDISCTFQSREDNSEPDAVLTEQSGNGNGDNSFNGTNGDIPASPEQIGYLRRLGVKKLPAFLTMTKASAMITERKAKK